MKNPYGAFFGCGTYICLNKNFSELTYLFQTAANKIFCPWNNNIYTYIANSLNVLWCVCEHCLCQRSVQKLKTYFMLFLLIHEFLHRELPKGPTQHIFYTVFVIKIIYQFDVY